MNKMADAPDSSRCNWPGNIDSIGVYCFEQVGDDERYRFEAHLLECTFCWNEVRRLEAIIRSIEVDREASRDFDGEIVSAAGISSLLRSLLAGHWAHAVIASILFGLMLAITVPMEIAFDYDRFEVFAWIASPIVFLVSAATTLMALGVDTKITRLNRNTGLVAAMLILLFVSTLNDAIVGTFLPPHSVTQASFQTWTARAAYLKGVVYCSGFALVFLLLPFHFVVSMQRELQAGRHRIGFELLTNTKFAIAPRGAPYLPVWVFCALLVFGAGYTLVSTAHLLEGLKATQYSNLFIHIIEIRWILFLALGAECCRWYYSAINELKRECAVVYRLAESGRNIRGRPA